MEDVERNFRNYLSLLSDNNVTLTAIGKDLKATIASENNALTFLNIISDGTRDTIELAFRLAVLDHLFPEGGCVAIFDDPFAFMDAARTKEGVKLLERFAEKNQVIFVSCDDRYPGLFEGNVIRLSRKIQ